MGKNQKQYPELMNFSNYRLSDRQIHRQLKLMGIKKKNGKERQ